jgi:NAD(P)-dependent dehydrogenase (short-subunit alcohol dehydrogenase family)
MTTDNLRRSIFITGGASGMGLETALLFAERGWFVGVFDVNREGIERVREQIGDEHGYFAYLDVTDADAFAEAIAAFGEAAGGRLDLMFNNAGIAIAGMVDEQPWDEIRRIIDINLMGVLIGVRAAVPLLRQTPGALCLTTSSSSALFGTAGIGIYSATKHAVRGLTEALSIELARYGVRAADLLPGLIDTPLLTDGLRASAPAKGAWRLVQPREVAETVWRAYHEDRLHWYIPEELRDFHRAVVDKPEAVRDERAGRKSAIDTTRTD